MIVSDRERKVDGLLNQFDSIRTQELLWLDFRLLPNWFCNVAFDPGGRKKNQVWETWQLNYVEGNIVDLVARKAFNERRWRHSFNNKSWIMSIQHSTYSQVGFFQLKFFNQLIFSFFFSCFKVMIFTFGYVNNHLLFIFKFFYWSNNVLRWFFYLLWCF